jgi:hypothetical protein
VIEVQLSVRSMLKTIAVFDGQVVEFFLDELKGGSRRMHAARRRNLFIGCEKGFPEGFGGARCSERDRAQGQGRGPL